MYGAYNWTNDASSGSAVVVTAILLGHLKKDAGEVKKALLSLDQALLTPECLKQLIDYAPDDDEVVYNCRRTVILFRICRPR